MDFQPMNVFELAKASGVSDATVVRMCHHIGYKGYYQLRITLSRDLGRKQVPQVQFTEETDNVMMGIFQEYANTMLAIGKNMDTDVARACVNGFRLPLFCNWTPEEWKSKGHAVVEEQRVLR